MKHESEYIKVDLRLKDSQFIEYRENIQKDGTTKD